VDVLFVGGYTRHHRHRAEIWKRWRSFRINIGIAYYLDRSRLCALAESPLGYLLPLGQAQAAAGHQGHCQDRDLRA